MKKVAIVYFSKTDVTHQLACALKEGLENNSSIEVFVHRIQGAEIIEGRFANMDIFNELADADAIVFGTPTYMGNVSAQFKSFADATSELWCDQLWAGKLAAGFTCGSAFNGDQSNTLQYMITLANQHGMLWLGLDSARGYKDHGINRLGCQLGVVACSENGELDEQDKATADYLGQRISEQLTKIYQ